MVRILNAALRAGERLGNTLATQSHSNWPSDETIIRQAVANIDTEQIVDEVESELGSNADSQGVPFDSARVREVARLTMEKVTNRLLNPSTAGSETLNG